MPRVTSMSRDQDRNAVDDDVCAIARKVLADLETFVDDTVGEDDDNDDDDDDQKAPSIGMSLDELQLILETSIRRHAAQTPSHLPIAHSVHSDRVDSPLRSETSKSPHRSKAMRRTVVRDNNLEAMQALLQAKQHDFARMREERRSYERLHRRVPPSRGLGKLPKHRFDSSHTHHKPKTHQHWEEEEEEGNHSDLSIESLVPTSRWPRVRSPRTTQQARTIAKDQATETETQHSNRYQEEKACNITPLDFGPAVDDIPEKTTMADIEEQLQSLDLVDRRPSFASNPASSFSSQSKSLGSSSASFDSSTNSSTRKPAISRNTDPSRSGSSRSSDSNGSALHFSPGRSSIQLNLTRWDPSPKDTTRELDWELDLSNFNP